ncbi:unnamed protein product, partial [Rotaria sp. Silwood1]
FLYIINNKPCRAIARLNKEVTAAREALATLKPQAGISQTIPM